MKRAIVGLLLVLVMAAPAWPAALTLTNEEQHIIGNLRAVTGTSTVNSGDTYAVPLNTIVWVGVMVRGTENVDWRHAISGTTVTFYSDKDGKTWEFFIIGY